MEIDPPPAAGPSTFRPTPALGVTYLLDTEEEDVKIIPALQLPPVDDGIDEDYDPRADQDIDEGDDPEDGPPYPTPSSIVRGKRKATEVYYDVDDEEEPRQSDRLRKKKARLESSRKEPEYICISSDSEDDDGDVAQIPMPKSAKTQKHHNSRSTPPTSAKLKQESGQDAAPPDESSASSDPEAEMGSVERLHPDTPNWIDVQLAKTRTHHPDARLEICYHYSIDGDVWRVKCKTCPRTCSVGPGQSLGYLNKHLNGLSHRGNIPGAGSASKDAQKTKATSRRDPSPRPAPKRRPVEAQRASSSSSGHDREAAAGRNRDGGGASGSGDDVERFLDQLGLPADLAPKLRSFGFGDDRRMGYMGRLSDESLGLLLEHLKEEGVGIVPAIMLREGLKRRAGTL